MIKYNHCHVAGVDGVSRKGHGEGEMVFLQLKYLAFSMLYLFMVA